MNLRSPFRAFVTLAVVVAALSAGVEASSHREAPGILSSPQVDATDFYMFRSYESGREDFVTLIANYNPLQDAYGGPNYFPLDPTAVYRIHIDNSGDGQANLTFEFRVSNDLRDIQVPVGNESVSIPLRNVGQITTDPASRDNLNVLESYTVRLRRSPGAGGFLTDAAGGGSSFGKPMDNVGRKSFPNYAGYAAQFLHDVRIPGCADGRVFVGQRRDSFSISLGDVFDLVNVRNPIGGQNAESDDLVDADVTSFILEAPISCLSA